ncbi:MAG: phosphoribosylanthranilate isomerase [Bosea sp. (in: a-proteobacteria)]
MSPITIKLCGLSTPQTMEAALEAGADMVALNFHPKSPRFVEPETATRLAAQARGRATLIALVVDLDDAALASIMAAAQPDLIQCHGTEDAARIAAIKLLTGRPVMRAVGVATVADLSQVTALSPYVDRMLLDAKPPKDATYPGGHGRPFDWSILAALPADMPFMLSGGLNPDNVADAIRRIRAMGLSLDGVDVSSGIESAPGYKDIAKIRDFVQAARAA